MTESFLAAALNAPPPRGFLAAIDEDRENGELAVIAEIKRVSPSVGDLAPDLTGDGVVQLAKAYQGGGASCLSVLTEMSRFQGSDADLIIAREAVSIPVLRKDFISTENEIYRSRALGADAALLIAADLEQDQLGELREAADLVDLDVLIEVHNPDDLEKALAIKPDAIGVNQRDLTTMELDPYVQGRLIGEIPEGIITIAESGITGSYYAQGLMDMGYDGVLVGSYLMTHESPARAVDALRRVRR